MTERLSAEGGANENVRLSSYSDRIREVLKRQPLNELSERPSIAQTVASVVVSDDLSTFPVT
jgi:hypothetical protein